MPNTYTPISGSSAELERALSSFYERRLREAEARSAEMPSVAAYVKHNSEYWQTHCRE